MHHCPVAVRACLSSVTFLHVFVLFVSFAIGPRKNMHATHAGSLFYMNDTRMCVALVSIGWLRAENHSNKQTKTRTEHDLQGCQSNLQTTLSSSNNADIK
jgi:hypothetical protein